MKNFRLNRRLAAMVLTGGIILTSLTGCGDQTIRIQELEEQVETLQQELEELKEQYGVEDSVVIESTQTIASVENNQVKENENTTNQSQEEMTDVNQYDDYYISMKNVIALKNTKHTLFVRYEELSDNYVTDIFTNAIYPLQNASGCASNVKELSDYPAYLFMEKYQQRSIGEVVPELLSRTTNRIPASILKDAYFRINGKATMTSNKEDRIDISKVLVLSNSEQVLFVKYEELSDNYVTDIFTNAIYPLQNASGYALNVKELGSYYGYIYQEYYQTTPLALISEVIQDIKQNQVSESLLKQLFMKLNNLEAKEKTDASSEMISIDKIIILKNEDLTLFVEYDNFSDNYVTDVFTGTIYEFCSPESYAANVKELGSYRGKILNEYYMAVPIIFEPIIIANVKNNQVSREILYEAFLFANGMSKEEVESSKQMLLTKEEKNG